MRLCLCFVLVLVCAFVRACTWTHAPVQLPIVLSSLVSLYFLELTDVLSPAMVGFRCNDRDLSMPYVETGDELIPLLMLLSLAFAGPAASVSTSHARLNRLKEELRIPVNRREFQESSSAIAFLCMRLRGM